MNLQTIKTIGMGVVRTLDKASPQIALAVSIVAGVGAVVAAVRATTKVDKELEEIKEEIDECNAKLDDEELEEEEVKETKKTKVKLYCKAIGRMAKLYASTIILEAVSIGTVLYSYGKLKRLAVSAMVAYNQLRKFGEDYREYVKEEVGEEKEEEIFRKTVEKDIHPVDVEGSKGDRMQKKKKSDYEENMYNAVGVRIFDECSKHWTNNADYNKAFLWQMEEKWTEKLRERGYVYLDEIVNDMDLGHPSKQMHHIGWVCLSEEDRRTKRVSFQIYENYQEDESTRRFINGYENSVIINFNHDGYIDECVDWAIA